MNAVIQNNFHYVNQYYRVHLN